MICWRMLVPMFLAAGVFAAAQDGTPFVLQPGDYRMVDLHVTQTPLRVDVDFHVLEGDATVRCELIPRSAFRATLRGMPHQALAATPEGLSGSFRQTIEDAGEYRVVIRNRSAAKAALVTLNVGTDLNPAVTAIELAPRRRITAILISFLVFFAMVGIAGWKLRKAAE